MILRALAISLSVILWAQRPAAAIEESCGTCHPEVKAEYDRGSHVGQFGCTGCHGGDANVVGMEAHAADKGYIGKPDRLQIPALCSGCHSDPVRMKPFGLATDQYAKYETSEHGVRLAQGDGRVAVCVDCHGTHRILPPSEPTSPVARQNISATCGRCHSNAALMAEYDLPADQEKEYRNSVHGIGVLIEEHPYAPTCATCHGAHGAAVSEAGGIATLCGHCHAQTREYFEQGPHRAATAAGQMSECASCHGYHAVSAPTLALFDTSCTACHAADTAAFSSAQKLKTLLSRAQESLDSAATEMDAVSRTFPTVVRYGSRLRQAKAYYVQAQAVQHSTDVAQVEDLTRSARSIAEDVRASVHAVGQSQQLRYIGVAAVWVYLLFAAAVAYLYKREKQREQR